jgi:hypothetical protein
MANINYFQQNDTHLLKQTLREFENNSNTMNRCKLHQKQKAAMIRIHIRTNENIAFKRAFFLLAK